MKTLYEVYIVKEDHFMSYSIVNEILANQNMGCSGFYSPNHNTLGLKVYVNDRELVPNCDFTMFAGELNFSIPLYTGDKVIIKDSILDNVKLITKNSYSRNTLFKYFSSNTKFKSNQIYDFILNVNEEEYKTEFLTKYDPFYTTIEKIRLDTGDLLANIPDSQIAKVIYINSKEAYDKLVEAATNSDEETTTVTTIPTYAKNYVRYKTDIDFCYAIYLSISGKYGTQTKKVGDIQIESTVKLPYIDNMIARFKELLKPNEDAFGVTSTLVSATFVKAQSSSYPAERTTVF